MFIINEIIGNLLLITGSLFLFSAGLGVLRMPDTYNRIHILIFFVMLTNPVSSHALARAAHSIGICETETTVIDQLADSNKSASIKNSDNKEVSE